MLKQQMQICLNMPYITSSFYASLEQIKRQSTINTPTLSESITICVSKVEYLASMVAIDKMQILSSSLIKYHVISAQPFNLISISPPDRPDPGYRPPMFQYRLSLAAEGNSDPNRYPIAPL